MNAEAATGTNLSDIASTRGTADTVYFEVPSNSSPRRVVPVGGNSLIVANFEVRIRSFFYPELIQYTAFLDGGDVWQRGRSVGAPIRMPNSN